MVSRPSSFSDTDPPIQFNTPNPPVNMEVMPQPRKNYLKIFAGKVKRGWQKLELDIPTVLQMMK